MHHNTPTVLQVLHFGKNTFTSFKSCRKMLSLIHRLINRAENNNYRIYLFNQLCRANNHNNSQQKQSPIPHKQWTGIAKQKIPCRELFPQSHDCRCSKTIWRDFDQFTDFNQINTRQQPSLRFLPVLLTPNYK